MIPLLLLVIFAAAAQDSPELAAYRELDRVQRLRPRDGAAAKAWLDEAGRLAALAADRIEQKRYAEAVVLLRATERPLSGAPSWNNLRGYAEFKTDNPKAALHYLQRAVQLEPDNEDYVLDIGEFLGSHGAHTEAVTFFEVAARRMPKSPRVTFGLAVSYILQNRRDQAQALLEELVRRQPAFEAAYKALGECYEDAGNSARMVELGRSLQSVNRNNPLGWYLEGAGLLREGRAGADSLASATASLRNAVRLRPADARARFALARALQESGDEAGAIAELRQTVRIDPDHERAHYVLGRLYQKTGNAEGAKTELALHAGIKKREANARYKRLLISIRE